ncbi:glycosyltransferase [Marinilongibacter aquaticus]|uniref:glycosyltransferase n=1 Tax=Marinilongibacter aquaticus TaxID=2975157 RepID=UPI0021BD835D|nr:glycosyltransferase [Marinilongibacter aquaticus]UBM58077.1 glycosyltransferase [Marinilongibacter aquaticus]
MKKKRIVFFVNSYAGGAELMTVNISKFLNPELYEIKFYIIGQTEGLIQQFIPEAFEFKLIQVKKFSDFLTFKIFKVLYRERPDIVFSSLMPINIRLCWASAFFPKTKVILRANNYLHTQSIVQKARLFLSYQFAYKLIVQTEEMEREHVEQLKLQREKVVCLPNPVNIERINNGLQDVQNPFKGNGPNYLYVGRISEVKGLDTLILAFDKVLSRYGNASLYIVGNIDGKFKEYYLRLDELIKAKSIGQSIRFVGFSENPYQWMKFSDCFVLPSKNEGLPNVLIEALYLGTPVASTKSVPVISRIVREGANGFLCEVGDTDGLAEAMINAVKLGRVHNTYSSASKEDFSNLFKL